MDQVANSSTPYLNAFSTERPHTGIDQMQARLHSALKLNDELADYFKERALVEDLYAKNLAKLNKKIFISDKSALGNILPAWEKIHNELAETSSIHSTFAAQMVDKIEHPLRSAIVNDHAYAEIRSMDPTFQKLAKDYDDRLGKLAKHKKILDKPGKKPADAETKYNEIKRQLDATKLEWQQYNSKYIQSFQTMDEHRWHDIKTYLLEFETIQNDQMCKRVQLAGENLSSVSHFSVEEEIISFCSQYATTTTSTTSMPSTQPIVSSLPPQSVETATPVLSSNYISPEGHISNLTEPVSPAHSSSFAPSILIDTMDEHVQPQSTKSTESYASSRTTGMLASTLSSVAEDTANQHRSNATPSIKSNKKASKQRKFLSSFSIRLKPKSSSSNQFGHQLPDLLETETTTQPSDRIVPDQFTTHDNTSPESVAHTNSPSTLQPPTLRKATSFADSFFNHPSAQHEQLQQSNVRSTVVIDDEGFSVPPPDRSPWTSTNSDDPQDLNDLTSLDNHSLYGTPRIKLDIKSNPVVQEDAKTSQVALTRVASMLKESNPMASKRPRGRRELRSQLSQGSRLSIYEQSTQSNTSSSSPFLMSTTLEEPSNPTVIDDPPHSKASAPPDPSPIVSPFAHDDDEDDNGTNGPASTIDVAPLDQTISANSPAGDSRLPGISLRITETIHAQLRQGQIQGLMVTGQIALLYQGASGNDGDESVPANFILTQDDNIETTFLDASIKRVESNDHGGTVYQFTPTDTRDYVTCIHYRQAQPHDLSSLAAPLIAKPMWKCDDTQARLMIKYTKANADVHKVMMLTQVGGTCHGAQSMPMGQWMVDQQRMIWSLDDDNDEDEHVVRAKFATSSRSDPHPIAIRFEMKNRLVSRLNVDPLPTSAGAWAKIEKVERTTRSGKYVAEV